MEGQVSYDFIAVIYLQLLEDTRFCVSQLFGGADFQRVFE